jgi:short subunit fatty acids transporter
MSARTTRLTSSSALHVALLLITRLISSSAVLMATTPDHASHQQQRYAHGIPPTRTLSHTARLTSSSAVFMVLLLITRLTSSSAMLMASRLPTPHPGHAPTRPLPSAAR